MAEIGSTLRETRIRKKIDITSVEEATKIRAKYLRALENEEWVVLPGPTYVKTFIRTYAEYLGLDSRLLVEEYSARFEEPEELELPAFSHETRMRTRVQRVPPPSGWVIALGVLVAIVIFLLVLGLTGGDGEKSGTAEQAPGPAGEASEAGSGRAQGGSSGGGGDDERGQDREPEVVRLAVVADREAWVCVVDAGGRRRVDARTMAAGQRAGPFRSSAFRVTIGNGGADLVVNGTRRDVPDRPEPVGYLIRPSGASVLSEQQRPTCG